MTQIGRELLRGAGVLVGSLIVLSLAIVISIVVHAGRDDAQAAAAVVVLPAADGAAESTPGRAARLDRANDLYRRGLAPRLLLVAGAAHADPAAALAEDRAYLIQRGMAASAIVTIETPAPTAASLRNVAAQLRASGVDSLMIVADPYHTLLATKIARDLGLEAHSTPVSPRSAALSAPEQIAAIASELMAYLGYVLGIG